MTKSAPEFDKGQGSERELNWSISQIAKSGREWWM